MQLREAPFCVAGDVNFEFLDYSYVPDPLPYVLSMCWTDVLPVRSCIALATAMLFSNVQNNIRTDNGEMKRNILEILIKYMVARDRTKTNKQKRQWVVRLSARPLVSTTASQFRARVLACGMSMVAKSAAVFSSGCLIHIRVPFTNAYCTFPPAKDGTHTDRATLQAMCTVSLCQNDVYERTQEYIPETKNK